MGIPYCRGHGISAYHDPRNSAYHFQIAHIIGQDLPVVGLPLGLGEVKVVLLGSLDDRRHRHLLAINLPEAVPDIAVVITSQGNLKVLDQPLLEAQFPKDVLFDLRGQLAGAALALIGDGKTSWVGPACP
jgi:hypothetical protein